MGHQSRRQRFERRRANKRRRPPCFSTVTPIRPPHNLFLLPFSIEMSFPSACCSVPAVEAEYTAKGSYEVRLRSSGMRCCCPSFACLPLRSLACSLRWARREPESHRRRTGKGRGMEMETRTGGKSANVLTLLFVLRPSPVRTSTSSPASRTPRSSLSWSTVCLSPPLYPGEIERRDETRLTHHSHFPLLIIMSISSPRPPFGEHQTFSVSPPSRSRRPTSSLPVRERRSGSPTFSSASC